MAFLLWNKHLLIFWLHSWSTVILEPEKKKCVTVAIVSESYLPWSDGDGCHDVSVLNAEF